MTSASREEVERVFQEACELAPDERERFLDDACREDEALRAQVRSLLHALGEADALEDPAFGLAPVLDAPAPGDLVGEQVGPFRLLRFLDEGGSAAVYEAEQRQPRRLVALKLMKKSLFSPREVRRFLDESEILARLDHPHIAHVHGAGEHGIGGVPVPYLAMEHLAEARSITRYARDEGLDLDARIALLLDVCDAVHHAHQKGVIHRDLKPSNLLVTEGGNVKVIDFGIAKVAAGVDSPSSGLTERGQVLGTLSYMSPEQCLGDTAAVDVRSDVYSLGVVLYELLCDAPPYELDTTSVLDATRRIAVQPPRRPRSLRPGLPADLERILLKSLEKEPVRRYGSALDLARDLQRFLANEPVEAHAPSVAYRFRKLVQRNKLASALAAVLLVSLATLGVGMTALYVEARSQRAVAAEQAAEVWRFTQSLSDVTLALLQSATSRAERDDATQRALDAVLARIRAQSPSVVRAQTFVYAANALRALGEPRRAADVSEEALATAALVQMEPEDLATLRYVAAEAFRESGRHERAIELYETAIAGSQRLDLLFAAEKGFAESLEKLRRFSEARVHHERAVGQYRRIAASLGDGMGSLPSVMYWVGLFHKREGDFEAAEAAFLEAASLAATATERRAEMLHGARNGLASLRFRQARFEESLAIFESLDEVLEDSRPADLEVARLHLRGNQALVLGHVGRAGESLALFEEVISGKARRHGEAHFTVAHSRLDRAWVRLREGDLDGAEADGDAAHAVFRATSHPDRNEFLGSACLLRARVALARGRVEDAARAAEEAIATHLLWLPEDHFQVAETRALLAEAREAQGDPEAARTLRAQSVGPLERTYGAADPRAASVRARLGG